MKNRIAILFLTIATLLSAQDFANYAKYAASNKAVLDFKTLVNTVFMGDSITEFWNVNDPTFFTKNNYINRGISGQTTSQMLLRFQQDVIDLKPKRVVIMAGTNDIAQNTGPISQENIFKNIKSMVEIARYNHIQVILCSVLPAYKFDWKKEIEPAQKIIDLNAQLKAFALQNKITYVDYHTAMKDDRNGLPPIYTKDEVHPNQQGYTKMEEIITKSLK